MNLKDHRLYVYSFFPKRNNISFEPKENVNYDQTTLNYMSSAKRANQITQFIRELMHSNNLKNPIIIDAMACIGGNTLSFLESRLFKKVISFEIDDKRRQMLINNIKSYELDKNSVIKKEFKWPDLKDYIIYFDPPWLDSNKKYVKTFKITNMTIEDILEKNTKAKILIFHVYPKYEILENRKYKMYKFIQTNFSKKETAWVYFFILQN